MIQQTRGPQNHQYDSYSNEIFVNDFLKTGSNIDTILEQSYSKFLIPWNPRSYMDRNIRNKQLVQDTHLRFSGNSTNSERSETSNRTIKSGSSYDDVRHVQNRDGQGRLQDIVEFNEFPIDYDDDIEENENVHGTEHFRFSNHSRGSNITKQSGSSYGEVQGVQNRDGQATGIQQLSYCPRGTRLIHVPLSP